MRNRLLALLSLLCVTLAINAQDAEKAWEAPSPKRAKLVDAPENGKHYLIYNTEAGGFMCNALSWGTQSCVGRDRANTYLLETKQIINRATGRPRMGTGGWTIKTINYVHWKKGEAGNGRDGDCPNISDKYVFIDSPTGSFQDMNAQGHNYFDLVPQGNGQYHIRAIATDDKFGKGVEGWNYDSYCFGVARPEAGMEMWETAPYYVAIAPNGEAETHFVNWQFADPGVYMALCDLYDALEANDAASEDMKVENVDAFVAVYNNEASTVEDIEKAIADLAKAQKDKINADFLEKIAEASEDNPVEITEMIKNANFNAGNINGWDCTFEKGKNATNLGYQSAKYENGDVKIEKFLEAWAAANTNFNPNVSYRALGDGQLSQTLQDMPAGKYRLTVDCISNQQDGKANPCTGVELFCSSGEYESSQNLSTGNGLPEHFEVEFLCVGGELTVGLRTKNATANWIAADNFQLYFLGELGPDENPAKIDLNGVIKSYAKWDEDSEDYVEYVANAEVKAAFVEALAAAKVATDNFSAAKAALQEAGAALGASIQDYKNLLALIDRAKAKSEELNVAGFISAEEIIGELLGDWQDAYDEGTYTAEDIAAQEDLLINAINESVSTDMKAGMEVTVLLKNPGFDTDFSGWTVNSVIKPAWGGMDVENDENAPGKKLKEINSGVAEVYHARFDISQTIKGMPAGLFSLSCKAFERSDDGNPVSAVLYAIINGKEQNVTVKSLNGDGSEEKLYYKDENNTWDTSLPNGPGGTFIPNTMSGANVYFAEGYYENKFCFLLDEPADVVVGIKTTLGNDEWGKQGNWVLFDDFRLKYEGDTAEPLQEVLTELYEQVSTAVETQKDDPYTYTVPALNDVEGALNSAATKLDSNSPEELQAEYKNLSTAYTDFLTNVSTCKKYADRLNAFNDATDTLLVSYVLDETLAAEGNKVIDDFGHELYLEYTTAQLEAGIAEADSLTNEMLKWVSFQNYLATFLKDGAEYAKVVEDAELLAKYEAAKTAVEGETYTKVTAELADYQKELQALIQEMAVWDAYAQAMKRKLPAGWEDASDDNLYEFTDYVMQNADLNKGADKGWSWNKEAQNGPKKDNGPVDGSNCMEFWNPTAKGNTFDFYQTIFGLPEGRYMLWVTAMVSKNGEVIETEETATEEVATRATEVEGGHDNCAKLYARVQNGAAELWHATPILTILDENPDAEIAATGDHDYCVYFDVPAAAEDAARGVEVTVGMKSCGNIGGRWLVADDFQLIYYGKASNKPVTGADAIQQVVSNATVKSTVIYNVAGAKQNRLQPGVNIIKTTLVDGTVRTAKVLVK